MYTSSGFPRLRPDEQIVQVLPRTDMDVRSPWRKVLPGELLVCLPGENVGTLYIMTERLLFLREIDAWKEVRSLMTPLSYPSAIVKEAELIRLKQEGARHYCEVWPRHFRVHRARLRKRGLALRVTGPDGREFAIAIMGNVREQKEGFEMILGRFRQ